MRRAAVLVLLWLPFLWLLGRTARPGPDFTHYVQWAQVGAAGSMFKILSGTGSPLGIPTTVWPHGTGFVLGTRALLRGMIRSTRGSFFYGTELIGDMLRGGWIAAVVFWWAMVRILGVAAAGRTPLVLLGTALTFLGTHAGYYSTVHATESLSLACGAVLALRVLGPRAPTVFDGLVAGMLGGLLVLVRPQLVPYAALALVVLGWRLRARSPSIARAIGTLLPAALMVLLAVAQVALVDRWMTGSLLQSPKAFSSGTFRSLDLAHPELLAILVHPWHGLLVYHPLYAVAFVALVVGMADRRAEAPRRALYAGLLLVTLLELYVQAAWFCWWMGLATFGMRGMAISAAVLVPALVAEIARRATAGRPIRAWLAVSVAAALWSYLLLQGETTFLTYGALLQGQLAVLPVGLSSICAAGAVSGALALRDRRPGAFLRAAGAGLWSLALGYLIDVAWPGALRPVLRPGVVALLAAALSVAFGAVELTPTPARALDSAVGLLVVLVFVTTTVAFVRLAVLTERFIASGQRPPVSFRQRGTVPLEEIAATYKEYQRVAGFDQKKAALADFLREAGVPP